MSIQWSQAKISPHHVLPGMLLFVMIMIGSTDLHLPQLKAMFPQLATMTIFYWGIYWPRLMPYWLVIVLGVLQDALYGLPLGVLAFTNVLLLGLLLSFRRYFVNATFLALWLSYALVALGQALVVALWLDYYFGYFVISDIALMQCLLSVLVYPAMQCAFFWFHIMLMRIIG